jgi:ubiquitin C-terminal hydrolase
MDLPLDITTASSLDEALGLFFQVEKLEECEYNCDSCKKVPVTKHIQLKRFNVLGEKLEKPIKIFKYLDLSKYYSSSGNSQENCQYQLTSMVTHHGGSALKGHYTAIGLAPNDCYYKFDDCRVKRFSTGQVLRTNPYILFYEQVNQKQRNRHPTMQQIISISNIPFELDSVMTDLMVHQTTSRR